MTKRIYVAIAIFAACVLGSTSHAWNATNFADQAGALAQVKADHAFSQWGGTTVTNYPWTVTNWLPDFGSIPVSNVCTGTMSVWTNDVQEVGRTRTFVLTPESTASEWLLRIQEFPSVAATHEMMMVRFSFRSFGTPEVGSVATVLAGDRCYVFESSEDHRTIYFCRNNVFVEVAAAAANYASCTGLVSALDEQILAASTED